MRTQSARKGLGPVARSLVSANRWLRGIKMYRFPWYLTLVSTNHASSNPGLDATSGVQFAALPMVKWVLDLRAPSTLSSCCLYHICPLIALPNCQNQRWRQALLPVLENFRSAIFPTRLTATSPGNEEVSGVHSQFFYFQNQKKTGSG